MNTIGRSTIRKGGSLTGAGATGKTSRFVKRWTFTAKPNTPLARLEAAYRAGFDAVDKIEERIRSAASSGRFTREGVRDDALSFALHHLIPDLHKARNTIRRAKQELAERKSKLKPQGPDPADLAGAFRRKEIRDLLRQMNNEEQPKYFARYGDNVPSDVVQAVLEMPPEFSGVTVERHEWLRGRALAEKHGPEISELAELEEAIATAESAVEIGRDEVRLEVGGLDPKAFDVLAAPVEAKHAAPWLRRRAGDVHVVDLERRVERKPTEEELANGIFASTHGEYIRAQTLVSSEK